MLTYVRKFTYLSAAKNSNKEYLTYGKGKHIIWGNHSFRRNLLRKQGFLCAFTWQSHQRHSWCSQLHLQRLPVGRDNDHLKSGYRRTTHSASMYSRIQDIREWRRVEISSQETEVASVNITQFSETPLRPAFSRSNPAEIGKKMFFSILFCMASQRLASCTFVGTNKFYPSKVTCRY